jgi:hypothetical protein
MLVVLLLASRAKKGGAVTSKTETMLAKLKTLAKQAGFPEGELDTAAAIAMAESGGDPGALNAVPGANAKGRLPERSVGLWQINVLAHPEFDEATLRNPEENARAALAVFRKAGGSWRPWGTYTTSDPRLSYRRFLP